MSSGHDLTLCCGLTHTHTMSPSLWAHGVSFSLGRLWNLWQMKCDCRKQILEGMKWGFLRIKTNLTSCSISELSKQPLVTADRVTEMWAILISECPLLKPRAQIYPSSLRLLLFRSLVTTRKVTKTPCAAFSWELSSDLAHVSFRTKKSLTANLLSSFPLMGL